MFFRSCQHFFRFRTIHRHARLTKDVFTCLERGKSHCGMHVRRRANPNDVQIIDREQIDWGVERIRDALKEYGPVYEKAA